MKTLSLLLTTMTLIISTVSFAGPYDVVVNRYATIKDRELSTLQRSLTSQLYDGLGITLIHVETLGGGNKNCEAGLGVAAELALQNAIEHARKICTAANGNDLKKCDNLTLAIAKYTFIPVVQSISLTSGLCAVDITMK